VACWRAGANLPAPISGWLTLELRITVKVHLIWQKCLVHCHRNNQADPFVIALAKVSGYTVITEETGIGSLGKIPGVCSAMKVECINLMQLIDAEDWVLG
jgi:hypothetical protein